MDTRLLAFRPKGDEVLVAGFAIFALTFSYWVPLIRKDRDIPKSFWYHVPQATGVQAESRRKKAEDRRIDHAFREQKLGWVVLWGSQSGRAEVLARQFAKSLRDRFGLRALAADLDDFDVQSLEKLRETQIVAFVISTYGDGEPPDNVCALWSYLNGSLQDDGLSSLRYAIFGLGNSNYRRYNYVAKSIDERLEKLGAKRLGLLGMGDDARGNTENDFLAWRKDLQAEMTDTFGLKELEQRYCPAFSIRESKDIPDKDIYHGQPFPKYPGKATQGRGASVPAVTAVKVLRIRRQWETNTRLCIHLDLDLGQDRRLKYRTGDHLAIWACNPDQEVDQLLECLGLLSTRHVPVTISATYQHGYDTIPVPSPTTMDALFRYYLEICGKLSMDTIAALADFAPSQTACQRLLQVSEDSQQFKSTIKAQNLTIGGLMKKMGGTALWNVPTSLLLENLKPMQPRYYSIASSAVASPRTVSITAAVNKPPHEPAATQVAPGGCYGLATNYLWALEKSSKDGAFDTFSSWPSYELNGPQGSLTGGKVFINIVASSFKLPMKSTSPIIMVGAGTGVAPYRAFVQERMQRKQIGQQVGRTMLFMGFRSSRTDFLYKDEWASYQKELGPEAFQSWAAFSRDDASKKEYVQHLVEREKIDVMELIDVPGCRLYICGSASMARDVAASLVRMREQVTGASHEDALQWLKRLRQLGTIQEDVWG